MPRIAEVACYTAGAVLPTRFSYLPHTHRPGPKMPLSHLLTGAGIWPAGRRARWQFASWSHRASLLHTGRTQNGSMLPSSVEKISCMALPWTLSWCDDASCASSCAITPTMSHEVLANARLIKIMPVW